MSNEDKTLGRRRWLITATSVMAAAGVAGAAVPFIKAWSPSGQARAAAAPRRVNVGKLALGEQIVVEWRGLPIFILRRTTSMLAHLQHSSAPLADTESALSSQPAYVDRALRSLHREFLVVVGVCTHLGCVPIFRPEIAPADLGAEWQGGYFCPCHASRYDLAGRVYQHQPAPLNLAVPPYRFESAEVLVIGLDQEAR